MKPVSRSFAVLWVFALFLILSGAAAADQGLVLQGTVVDESGAPLPGATVTLKIGSEKGRDVTTDREGQFRFENVAAGTGTVHAELEGFQAADKPVTIGEKAPAHLTVKMKVGFSEDVTVTGEAPDPLMPTNNADAVELSVTAIRWLPSDTQNLLALVGNLTAPGVVPSIVIDGNEGDTLTLPAAAIHRMTINQNPYSAEFNRPGKSRVDVETEHGSRKFFHGSGAVLLRNGALQARNVFATTVPEMDRRFVEGSFGGPLPKKGMAFFVSGQGFTNGETAVVNAVTLAGPFEASVPTDEHRTTLFGRVEIRPSKTRWLSVQYSLFDDAGFTRGLSAETLPEQAYDTGERRQQFELLDHEVLSAHLVNDMRVGYNRVSDHEGTLPSGSSEIVEGAFTGGTSQTYATGTDDIFQLQDVATLTVRRRSVRFGGRLKARRTTVLDGTNFGGTYEYSSLDDYARRLPFVFRQSLGSPSVSFADNVAYLFAQTELRPSPNFSLTVGARYEWQSALSDANNLAPRVSAAYAPHGGKTILRGGVGVFYTGLPSTAIEQARLYDGHIHDIVIANPTVPINLASAQVSSTPVSIWRIDDRIESPSSVQASVAVEQPLWPKAVVSAEYRHSNGVNLLRARNLNAPDPRTGVRLDGSFLDINQVESTGSSRANSMAVTFRGRLSHFKGTMQYMLSKSTDDTSGLFYLPADNQNLAAEYGRSDFDRRHVFTTMGVFELPQGMHVGTVINLGSGTPYDITTGFDTNRDLVAKDRPAGVTRNAGQAGGLAEVDLRLTKVFRMPRPPSLDPESKKRDALDNFELNLDAFNAFNRTNYSSYVGVLSSPRFGRPNAAKRSRTLQISLRYRF